MRVLSVTHGPSVPGGVFDEEVEAAGHALERWDVPLGGKPQPPSAYDAIMVFGGSMHPDQDAEHVWLEREAAFLSETLASEVPVFGLCLGAQMLARAAGAWVGPAPDARGGLVRDRAHARRTRRPGARRASAATGGVPVAPLHLRRPGGRDGARPERGEHAGVPPRPGGVGGPVPRGGDPPDAARPGSPRRRPSFPSPPTTSSREPHHGSRARTTRAAPCAARSSRSRPSSKARRAA